MTLAEAERYLLSLELFGMRFGLDRMRRLMTVLGSPQERYETIHVVGTNGKSSTARMTAAILRRHGLRTGTYLSPHLVSFTERVRIDDEDSSPERFAAAVERARHAAEMVDRTLGARRRRHAVRGAHGGRLRRAGRRRGAGRRHRGGPRRALRRHQRHPLARAGADQRRPGAHALAGAHGGRHRAREARRGAAGRDPGRRRRPASRRAGAGAAHVRGARRAPGRGGHELDPAPPSRCWPAAPTSGATSRSRAPRPRPTSGRWTRAPWRAAAASTLVPGRFEVVDTRAGHRPRRRAQPRRHGRAGRGAARLPRRPAPGGLHLDPRRQGRRRHAARAAAAVRRGHLHRERQPARAAARARCSRCAASSAARRRAPCATRARRSRQARAAAGPDGVALATGTIYLIADLLRPERAGAERAEHA